MDIHDLHRTALGAFSQRVDHLPPQSWQWATPCSDWDVHNLVNHVVDRSGNPTEIGRRKFVVNNNVPTHN